MMSKQKILAVAGFIAIIPALLLVTMGLSGLEPFKILDNPFIILGGLAVALAVNIFAVAKVNTHFEDSNFVGSLSVKLNDGLINLGVIALGFILLSTLSLYLFLENFQPR